MSPKPGMRPRQPELVRMQIRFEEAFERFRERYRLLERCLHHRKLFLIGFAACVLSMVFLIPWLGQISSGSRQRPVQAPPAARTGRELKRRHAFVTWWNNR
jgi:multidrug efflux pump subunit AcrB